VPLRESSRSYLFPISGDTPDATAFLDTGGPEVITFYHNAGNPRVVVPRGARHVARRGNRRDDVFFSEDAPACAHGTGGDVGFAVWRIGNPFCFAWTRERDARWGTRASCRGWRGVHHPYSGEGSLSYTRNWRKTGTGYFFHPPRGAVKAYSREKSCLSPVFPATKENR